MKILNFGSLNIDHVYEVDHFVRPGETLNSLNYTRFCGGKGLNQSIALSCAGADVYHAGKIGQDGSFLKKRLDGSGVDTSNILSCSTPTGHASIQVNSKGENSIILYGGANRELIESDTIEIIDSFEKGDFLLIQNEVNSISSIIKNSWEKGLIICFNPAPMAADVLDYPLDKINYFIVNEIEGECFTRRKKPYDIIRKMAQAYPDAAIILTLGSKGAIYKDSFREIEVPAEKVRVVDTTAAGDTFTGYFIAWLMQGKDIKDCLSFACKAAGLCVTKSGAADSIPELKDIEIQDCM